MTIPSWLQGISKQNHTWRNATRNVEVTPFLWVTPRHKEDISAAIQYAEKEGLRVRAVGSGHSYSDAPKGRDLLLSMQHLIGVQRTDPRRLKAESKNLQLVTVQAGTKIHDLNKTLDNMGLALRNMGAVDYQTVSGALMTGTHGSGIDKPAFPDMVRALRLVGSGGKYIQIEPSDGITDATIPPESEFVELIQDDDLFYATVLSFGAMGIVHELILDVVDAFWMEEQRSLTHWKELRTEILNGCFLPKVRENDFMGFRINPYPVDKKHLCAVAVQNIIDKQDRQKGLNAKMKNLLSVIGSRLRIIIASTIKALNRDPSKAPGRIQTALKTTKDRNFTGKSFKVLFQSGPAVAEKGYSSEFAFEAKPEILVGAIEASVQLAELLAKQHNFYQSSFLSVRFVKQSKALLSPNFGRDTFYLDVPLLRGTKGERDILAWYQLRMMELGGIPHWGKINERLYEDQDFLETVYGERLTTWRRVQEALDPNRTFINDFIEKTGLVGKAERPVA